MSYILEALRKAEQLRRRGDVPGLDEPQILAEPENRPWRANVWLALLGVNLVLLALVLWTVRDRADVTDTDPDRAPQIDSSRTADEAPARTKTRPVRPPARPVAPAPLLTPIPDLQPIPPAPKPAAEPRGTVRISPVELDQSPLEEGVIEASQPGSGQPASEPQADLAAQERLPVWPQIPTALFAQLPDSLKLDVHVYANLPAERFVLVNLQKYREGETLREGPVLEEITPQGVILSFRGQRFELLAK